MRKNLINSFLAIALIAIGYGIYRHLASKKKKKPTVSYTAPENNFEFINIKNNKLKISFSQQGKVVNKTNISVSPEVSGKIIWAAPLNEGQTVKKNQVLYRVDNTNLQFQLKTLKSDFLQQFANILIDLESDFPEKKNRWTTFFNNIKIESSLPKLPTDISTKEKTFLASRGIYKQYYSIQQQEYLNNKHIIISPFSGVISNIKSKEGSVISPNTSLLNISKNNALEIKVAVSSLLSNYISVNDKIMYAGNKEGKISRIDTKVDEKTQSINVYILPKKDSELKEGNYIMVNFNDIFLPASSKLPISAIYDGNNVVTILPDSTTRNQSLNILYKSSDFLYTNSLKDADVVIKNIGKDFIIGQKIK